MGCKDNRNNKKSKLIRYVKVERQQLQGKCNRGGMAFKI